MLYKFSFFVFSLVAMLSFVSNASEGLSHDDFVLVRVWKPSRLPYGTDGHVSISIKNKDKERKYISIDRGAPSGQNFLAKWNTRVTNDKERFNGQKSDFKIKFFSLNNDAIIRYFEEFRNHITYNPDGDAAGINFSHNSPSLAVELLKQGEISAKLLSTEQQSWTDAALAVAKCAAIGAPIAGAGIIAGPALASAAASAGFLGGAATLISIGAEESFVGVGKKAVRETRAAILDPYHEKKYGHAVLAPVGYNLSDRFFAITVHQFIDFINKAKTLEQLHYPLTASW